MNGEGTMSNKIEVSKIEHISKVFDSTNSLLQNIENITEECKRYKDINIPLMVPEDLEVYLGKKGLQYKDTVTKCTSYLTGKMLNDQNELSFDDIGVIYATEYSNLESMLHLSRSAKDSTEAVSARLFPNATISSATVSASIYSKIRGLNLTLNHGLLSFVQALSIARDYITQGKLEKCLILVGEDYNTFSMEDVTFFYQKPVQYLSSLNGVLLSKYTGNDSDKYILRDIHINNDMEHATISNQQGIHEKKVIGGYCLEQSVLDKLKSFDQSLLNPPIYMGASISFMQLVSCMKDMEKNSDLTTCESITVDNTGGIGRFTIERNG